MTSGAVSLSVQYEIHCIRKLFCGVQQRRLLKSNGEPCASPSISADLKLTTGVQVAR